MTQELRVLLIDDDAPFRAALLDSFVIAGIAVEAHGDPVAALLQVDAGFHGIVVTDIRMPKLDGHAVADAVTARDPEIPVILMTGHGDIATAVAALKCGAFDFIAKPFATDHMLASVGRAIEMRRLVLENRRLTRVAEEAEGHYPLLGETLAMVRLRDTIRQLAQIDVDVLIEGETGTGKELVARQLHRWSARKGKSFVAIDCAALPEHLADETLFGTRGQAGRITEADRGTLFLDEIDSMSPALQGRLLRVVEERELPATGTSPPRSVDLRIIAAAKSDLRAAVADGRFREDLLYRLETVRLLVPALRDRRADAPLLFAWFAKEAAEQYRRAVPSLTAEIEARLMTDPWRGNVRALRNYAVQATLGFAGEGEGGNNDLSLAERLDRYEAALITGALTRTSGDVAMAADVLRIAKRSLYDRIQRHSLDPAKFRH